VVTMV